LEVEKMPYLLSSENVLNYLVDNKITDSSFDSIREISPKSGKNFNLLVSFHNNASFLVKQERFNQEGETLGEFWNEWYLQKLLGTFPELAMLRSQVTETVHFDADRSIMVFEYLQDFLDLSDFYRDHESREERFPPAVAAQLADTLALIHRSTYRHQEYENYLTQLNHGTPMNHVPSILYELERIGVEVFGCVRLESLEFLRLFQRFDSLRTAIAELKQAWSPTCLTHQDIRLRNVLLHRDWETMTTESAIRLIDWEKIGWGDPAYDLGGLTANYLGIWLGSLVVHKGLDIATSLKLAGVPLAQLQPSLSTLVRTYLEQFPEILSDRPDFLRRVTQFAGVTLIDEIVIKLNHRAPFDNLDICALQVAKTLLCQPEQGIRTIFGGV
jgi:hypothetical protein